MMYGCWNGFCLCAGFVVVRIYYSMRVGGLHYNNRLCDAGRRTYKRVCDCKEHQANDKDSLRLGQPFKLKVFPELA